jgi:hypothetical protein
MPPEAALLVVAVVGAISMRLARAVQRHRQLDRSFEQLNTAPMLDATVPPA